MPPEILRDQPANVQKDDRQVNDNAESVVRVMKLPCICFLCSRC